MQCPNGNAASGHPVGEIEVVQPSRADDGSAGHIITPLKGVPVPGPGGTCKLEGRWRAGAEEDSLAFLFEHQRSCHRPQRVNKGAAQGGN